MPVQKVFQLLRSGMHRGQGFKQMDDGKDISSRSMMRARLFRSRFVIAACCLVLAVQAGLTGASLIWPLVGIVLIILVAAVAPRREIGEPKSDRNRGNRTPSSGNLSVQALADSVPDPLVIFSHDGSSVHVNEAAKDAFAPMTAGASVQLKFRTPEMQQLIREVIANGGTMEIEYAEKVPVERWFSVTAVSVGDNTGLFVLVFKDQSEARRIERMRSDFIANASHELRTPLASVAGFIDTLKGSARNDPKAQEQFLHIMEGQAARMARLIDDLLSLSRLEMKPYLKPATKVDLREVLEGVVESLKPLASDLGIAVEKDYNCGDYAVFGDRDELTQVFENLLENACKYGQSGKKIIVGLREETVSAGHAVTASIRDFGPGIAEEHIPRITERFYRINAETSRVQKGTGLGLSIVKHILTRHRARLSIDSRLGEGATFSVHFQDA